jgi:hypothetical protein
VKVRLLRRQRKRKRKRKWLLERRLNNNRRLNERQHKRLSKGPQKLSEGRQRRLLLLQGRKRPRSKSKKHSDSGKSRQSELLKKLPGKRVKRWVLYRVWGTDDQTRPSCLSFFSTSIRKVIC